MANRREERRQNRQARVQAVVKEQEAQQVVIKYLDDELNDMIVRDLGVEVAAIFADADHLDEGLVEEYGEAMSTELYNSLLELLDITEEESPAPPVAKPIAIPAQPMLSVREQRRAERKLQQAAAIQQQTKTGVPGTITITKSVDSSQTEDGGLVVKKLETLLESMNKEKPLLLRRLSKSTWSIQPIDSIKIPAKSGGRRRAVNTDVLKSPEYEEFRTQFVGLDYNARVKLAKEKFGVTPDNDACMPAGVSNPWITVTKEGHPMPENMQKMKITAACRLVAGVEKYIEEARDRKVRKQLAYEE